MRILGGISIFCLSIVCSVDAYIRYDLRDGGQVWFESSVDDEIKKLRVVLKNELSSSESGRILIIYDGDEALSYDPYADQQLSGGVTREQAIFQSDFDVAINAQSIEHACQLLGFTESEGAEPFDRIYVVDHGIHQKKGVVQSLGREALTPKKLSLLAPFLSEAGDLCLYGCRVGSNVGYLKKVSKYFGGRKIWAYASSIRYSMNNPQPLQNPETGMFFSYPFGY